VIAAFAIPAGAGPGVISDNMVTIKKTVVGAVPAGTTFTVHVVCQITIGKHLPTTRDVIFDATGTATSGNAVIGTTDFEECTATETVTGGAIKVGFDCTSTSDDAECDTTATSATVEFIDVSEQSAIITVTNTFPAPVVPVAPIVPAAEVVVAPAFTG
jgi:hypothetical protein